MARHQTDRPTGTTTQRDDLVLDAAGVRDVADVVGRAASRLLAAPLAEAELAGPVFGGSAAGVDLGAAYGDVHADHVVADEDCAAALVRFRDGLRAAVADLDETDALGAAALDRIGRHGPCPGAARGGGGSWPTR